MLGASDQRLRCRRLHAMHPGMRPMQHVAGAGEVGLYERHLGAVRRVAGTKIRPSPCSGPFTSTWEQEVMQNIQQAA